MRIKVTSLQESARFQVCNLEYVDIVLKRQTEYQLGLRNVVWFCFS